MWITKWLIVFLMGFTEFWGNVLYAIQGGNVMNVEEILRIIEAITCGILGIIIVGSMAYHFLLKKDKEE